VLDVLSRRIFVFPRLLNYIVAAYFVVVGVLLILEATD
jgi:Protein of unknown function (DUF3096)